MSTRVTGRGTHPCPATGCGLTVYYTYLMCPGHWRLVPKPLQNAVYAAWLHGEGEGTEEHIRAIDAAIRAVNEKIG